MRLIDADKLMEELREIEADGGIGMDFVTFEDLIKGQPSINEWIGVKYRLPQKETYVLVCFDDGFIATVFFGEDFELWLDSGEPIAWMPLPEPYKKEVE